jgi:hypothetical protein
MCHSPRLLLSAAVLAAVSSVQAANLLFVVGNTTLNSGDAAVQSRLQGLGHTVTLVSGAASKVGDATGRAAILISSTISSADVAAKFTSVAVPVMCWEPALLDDLRMCGATDSGATGGQTQVRIVRATSSIAGGLTGRPAVFSSAQTVTWAASLPSAAQSVATLAADGNRSVLFHYEAGAQMVAMGAPARRAGFLLGDTSAAALNTSGWGLFDRTLAWLLSPPAALRPIDPTEVFEPAGPAVRSTPLVFSEIHYHPRDRADLRDLEFIELYNSEPWPRNLTGFRLSGEVSYSFPSNTVIAAKGYLVVARVPADVQAVYNLTGVLGPYVGALSNAGGTVRLRHRNRDAVLLEVEYNNAAPWPAQCDGAGHSLVLARPSYGHGDPRAWAPSGYFDGSPGAADVTPADAENALVINEILTHTDPPQVDFVEIYNHGTNTLDLSGLRLSDNPYTNFFAFASGSQIAPGGRVAVTQDKLGFNLSSAGEKLFLWNSAGDRILDAVNFGAKENGWSFGRFPDGHPEWHELSSNTPGTANTGIRIRDVVINEVMYHPITEDARDEWIELHNRGAAAADLSNWRFTQGVAYTFAPGTVIPAGGFLVVSANRARFLTRYPAVAPASVVGDWSGSLADGGELIRLAKPDDPLLPLQDFVPVDEVAYLDGGQWPVWADGGGSTLELIDPASDNRRATNWADSDESAKAPWTTITSTGVLDNGRNTPNEVHILTMGAGEMVVDKIVVRRSTDGSTTTRVSNSDFQSNLTGWVIQGNHIRSFRDTTQGADGSTASLRIVATGGGDNGVNRVESDLSTALASGNTATLQLKGRWLKGNPRLLMRLKGNYLEASGTLTVPTNLGTPAAVNSRKVTNAGAAITHVAHYPVLPAAAQAVTVTARVADPQGVASVSLKRRLDPATTYTTTAMLDGGVAPDQVAGDGIYTANLPGQAAGAITVFYVEAVDAGSPATTTRFPVTAPTLSECHVIHGQTLRAGDFGSYRFVMPQANLTDWTNRQKLSNELIDCTVVYNDVRAIYGSGIRYRGSPFIRPSYVSPIDDSRIAAYVFSVPKDQPLIGSDGFNLDALEQPIRDPSLQSERMAYWLAEQLGGMYSYQRYVHGMINTYPRGPILADTFQGGGDYVDTFFPGQGDGEFFEVDDWFEFNDNSQVTREFNENAQLLNYTTTGGVKKQARYRWSWEKKNYGPSGDTYQTIYDLVDALNQSNASLYTSQVKAVIDIDSWMLDFAVRRIAADWDGYGYNRGKNTYLYRPPGGKVHMALWDLDFSFGADSRAFDATLLSEINDPTLNNFYAHPEFGRRFYSILRQAVDGPMNATVFDALADDHYAVLLANSVPATAPTDMKTWVANRRAYISGQIAPMSSPAFAITTNGGANFSTSSSSVTLAGTSPIEVAGILVNGQPADLAWSATDAWSLVVYPVSGANLITLTGVDRFGNAVPGKTDTITVTYTGSNPPLAGNLVITEIHYNPLARSGFTDTDLEFIELKNRGSASVSLSGVTFSSGITYAFAPGTTLAPGQFRVLTANTAAFNALYPGVTVTGEYTGQLSNGGETVTLSDGLGGVITTVTYDDAAPWPTTPDGTGPSLVPVDPNPVPPQSNAAAWRASTNAHGSPGANDP